VIVRTFDGGAWAELQRTAYVLPGTRLSGRVETNVAALAELEGSILLAQGDTLLLTRSLEPGRGALHDAAGRLLAQARIGCTLPEVFECVKVGEAVWLDDGRIGGKVREANADLLALEITHARPGGERLRADKGINLPDTTMNLPALTTKDLRDLEFVARHADAVALSFVHAPEDIDLLEDRLRELGRPELGIVLKVETRRAFDQLPQLLLASLQSPSSGVMIARGDLAVECGFERLAEIQEEILWIAEAAHIPVIWATQVLETLAKTGRPSRAEITDAAMGERAECVMLNKGPHIETAVRVLDDILRRMEGHQRKKSPRLRPLRLAHRLGEGGAGES
jgi:pyruvate kinase